MNKTVPLIFALVLSLIFAGCIEFFNEREDCNGYVRVVNPIPDTTLVVDGPTYERNLESPPIVFEHTGDKVIDYEAISTNREVAGALILNNVLNIEPRSVGVDTVLIRAKDACDKTAATTFEVTVTE